MCVKNTHTQRKKKPKINKNILFIIYTVFYFDKKS